MLSSKNIKSREYSYNSYEDIGVFFTIVLSRMVTLNNRSLLYVWRILLLK
jgi:hypothetical protein